MNETKLIAIVKAIDLLLEEENINSENGFEVVLSIRATEGRKAIQSGLLSGTIGGVAESILRILHENPEIKRTLAELGLREYEREERNINDEKFKAKWN